MASSCGDIREELIECVKRSDCMTKANFTFHECVKQPKEAITEKCVLLRQALFECKRGQLDMRYRFRGNIRSSEEAQVMKEIQKDAPAPIQPKS